MHSKMRVLKALCGGQVDRPPVANIVTGVTQAMMQASGAYWPEAHRKPDMMAKLGAAGHVYYGFDTVKVPFDVVVEAEALGAEVNFGDIDIYPQSRHFINSPQDMQLPDDFLTRGRVPVVLEAVRLLREWHGADAAVVAHAMGPFSLCNILIGASDFLVWLIEQPDQYQQAMQYATEIATHYSRALIKAGADVIQYGEAAASGNMISGRHYQNFVAPYHKQLIESIGAPTVLHICGNITDRLNAIAQTGVTAISFDERVDLEKANEILKGRTAMVGNVPVQLLAQGQPNEVHRWTQTALEMGINVICAGCSLVTDTPGTNLHVMAETTAAWQTGG